MSTPSFRRVPAAALVAAALAVTAACAPPPAPKNVPPRSAAHAPTTAKPPKKNRAPVIDAVHAPATALAAPARFTVSVTASDPDGDPLEIVWNLPAGVVTGAGPHTVTVEEPEEWSLLVTVRDKPRSGDQIPVSRAVRVVVDRWDAEVLAARESAIARRLVALMNDERAGRGVLPLTIDDDLTSSARGWSSHLAGTGTFWPLLHDTGWLGARDVTGRGENLHARSDWAGDSAEGLEYGFGLASAAHAGWMHSVAHRDALLDAGFDRVGVGVLCDPSTGRVWVVARFAGDPTAAGSVATPGPSEVPIAAALRTGADLGVTCVRG